MTTTTNTPTPTGLDLVIERLRALTAELQQQQAAAAAEPAAPLPVVLTAPEPEQEELDHTALANALIDEVAEAAAPEVARLIRERVGLWLHRHQLALPALQALRADDVRAEIHEVLFYPVGRAGEFTRAPRAQWKHREPGAQGSHRYRLF